MDYSLACLTLGKHHFDGSATQNGHHIQYGRQNLKHKIFSLFFIIEGQIKHGFLMFMGSRIPIFIKKKLKMAAIFKMAAKIIVVTGLTSQSASGLPGST